MQPQSSCSFLLPLRYLPSVASSVFLGALVRLSFLVVWCYQLRLFVLVPLSLRCACFLHSPRLGIPEVLWSFSFPPTGLLVWLLTPLTRRNTLSIALIDETNEAAMDFQSGGYKLKPHPNLWLDLFSVAHFQVDSSLFQNETTCEIFDTMTFFCSHKSKTHFQIKGWPHFQSEGFGTRKLSNQLN